MESTSANKPDFDPAADLALIDRAKATVAMDQLLDFGPAWYAPALATCLGSATLFGQNTGNTNNIIFGVVGFATGLLLAVHDYRRRAVCARPSMRSAAAVAPIAVLMMVILSIWGTAVSTIGYDDFVPVWAVVAWIATTCVLLAVRSLLHARRRRRGALG